MLAQLIGLRKIPNRALRLVITASSKNPPASFLVLKFLPPPPPLSGPVHYAKRACPLRVRVHCIRSAHGSVFVHGWNCVGIPRVAPGICTSIRPLGRILPLPLVRQTLPRPSRVGARILQRHPRNRPIVPTRGVDAILPVAEEIQIVLRMIAGGIEELLELRVGHGILINPE